MDNPELILQSLEHFPKLKDEDDYNIPVELEEYIHYVAKTGDPVFQWTLVKPLFREKMIKVITDFFESNPSEIPDYPNVTNFNYDTMKETLLERIDWFKGAPFTIQRISELLVNPTKEYNRVDKYMRALEKNIYVVSTREPGMPQPVEENNSTFEESFVMNGNDFDLKSSINEESGSKEEEGDAAAILLLKKCSSVESDDANFNVEVDVTNTVPSEETPQEEEKLDSSVEINVHETSEESDVSTLIEGKSGHTRKLEEDELEEKDPKRFKLDDGVTSDASKDEAATEEVKPDEDEMNIDDIVPEAASQSNDELKDTSDDNMPKSKEDIEIEKVDVEMEIEETVINKIESFDNNKSESSLDISEGDSMVISQESASSSEEVEKSIEDNIDVVVSESSDMDLSDGVSTVDLKTSEITALLDLPESDGNNSVVKESEVEISDIKPSDKNPEEAPVVKQDIPSSTTISDIAAAQTEISSSIETDKPSDNIIDSSDDTASEPVASEEPSVLETASNEADTPDTSENQVATLEKEVEEEASSVEHPTVIHKPQSDVDTIEQSHVESSTEINTEIEEAILQEDEFENPEEVESSVDPLSTESEAEPLVEETEAAAEDVKSADVTSENTADTSVSEPAPDNN